MGKKGDRDGRTRYRLGRVPECRTEDIHDGTCRDQGAKRLEEMTAKGEKASYEEVLANVLERDRLDSGREKHPLVKAPDAVLLDNGNMTVEQQMEWFKKLMKRKWGITLK